MTEVFAAFVVCRIGNEYLATTRPNGGIGLPGGKVEAGETPAEAAVREAMEEGWSVQLFFNTPIHSQLVDGKLVQWFLGYKPRMLSEYKEQARGIKPTLVSREQVRDSGFGNDELPIFW